MMSVLIRCALVMVALVAVSVSAGAEIDLAISYYQQGEADRAGGLYTDAASLLNEALDETTVDWRRAAAYDALGRRHIATGDYTGAEEAFRTALCLKEKSMGAKSRTVPVTLNGLGDLYYVTGDLERAESYYRDALDIHLDDQLNVEACRSLNGLALIHADRGELAEAKALLDTANGRHVRALRRDHPLRATVLTNLAILHLNLDRASDAVEYLATASYVQGKSLRGDHPDVALRLEAEAETFAKLGRLEEAYDARARAELAAASFAKANLNTAQ